MDVDWARDDAMRLHNAGEGRLGTDEDIFVDIFASRSWIQLNAIATEYQQLNIVSLEAAINSELSGDIQRTLLAIRKISVSVQYLNT